MTALCVALGLVLPAVPAGADPVPVPLPPRPTLQSPGPVTPAPGVPLPTLPPRPVPLPCPPTCLTDPDPYDAVVYGDSYTSGEGASHDHKYVTKADGTEDFRHRSGLAPFYVAWAALEMGRNPLRRMTLTSDTMESVIGRDRLFFQASSGAWIKHLDEEQKEKKGGTVVRNPPQAQDVPTMAKLVYFGLGGNDAGFADLVSTAATAYLFRPNGALMGSLTWPDDQEKSVALEMGRLQPRVAELKDKVARGLWSVRETHPVAEIVVALYPLGVKASGNTGIEEITGRTMDLMYPFAVQVNQAIRDGVAKFQADYPQTKVHIFDPNTAGPNGTSVVAGHELGQPDSYFQGLVHRPNLLLSKPFQSYQESFHPNEPGAVALGKALATFLAGKFPALFPNGPKFSALTMNPQPLAQTQEDMQAVLDWAVTNGPQLCEDTDADSVCRALTPDGIVLSKDLWFDPSKVRPFPGSPTPGGPDTGTPGGGGGGGGGGSTWIPADYIPKDPCDIFRPVRYEYYAGVKVQGGPLQTPITIDGLVMAPKKPKCVPGVGLIFE
ncbi:unnamed protein product [[Actinomadura] parvosata subsp. kistnae]|uniref:SGNH hydrolase-type esterase domain-containing protein n=1 Tax=[Actinomadura] parvosata subsp. kistnae TaxID=1909395 RepID=A0A1V0AF63_9ACTN|nr:hypothetical protein BKM31_51590 [Nonomuraea sp. ATCC 55076]SPL92678.1 unnamed protein product [Actinomadura parvosata subsp. kistnae]